VHSTLSARLGLHLADTFSSERESPGPQVTSPRPRRASVEAPTRCREQRPSTAGGSKRREAAATGPLVTKATCRPAHRHSGLQDRKKQAGLKLSRPASKASSTQGSCSQYSAGKVAGATEENKAGLSSASVAAPGHVVDVTLEAEAEAKVAGAADDEKGDAGGDGADASPEEGTAACKGDDVTAATGLSKAARRGSRFCGSNGTTGTCGPGAPNAAVGATCAGTINGAPGIVVPAVVREAVGGGEVAVAVDQAVVGEDREAASAAQAADEAEEAASAVPSMAAWSTSVVSSKTKEPAVDAAVDDAEGATAVPSPGGTLPC